MLKICKDKWNKNRSKLYDAILNHKLPICYIDLVKLSVDCILNDEYLKWDTKNITVIDNGDYQGTLLFVIPEDTYQPREYEYLLTYAGYGSCSGCDSILSIISDEDEMTDSIAKGLLMLCKDLITNIVKPYNYGWREDEEYKTVEVTK